MPKSAPRLADPPLHATRHNGASTAFEKTDGALDAVISWYQEIVSLIPKETRKLVRKTIRKAARRYGPEIATAVVTGIMTSLLMTEPEKKKKKKKKKS